MNNEKRNKLIVTGRAGRAGRTVVSTGLEHPLARVRVLVENVAATGAGAA